MWNMFYIVYLKANYCLVTSNSYPIIINLCAGLVQACGIGVALKRISESGGRGARSPDVVYRTLASVSFVCMVGGGGGWGVGWSSWERVWSRDTRIHVSMPLNAMNCQCYSAEEKVNLLDKGQFYG